ncbi:MAG: AbrB/MazE/SpoVT family DNA-binding domain-containing protein [Deltaproteobacteria bacterium]|nr:AbrB/MazE/SpoVT family DNA-binding domain-containing protein [Deltaproteobacteria bacterium]
MPITTLSAKGQVTLPARLRKYLGMKPHDRLIVEATGDAIVIRRTADFFELEGFLGKSLPAGEERQRMLKAVAARNKRTNP